MEKQKEKRFRVRYSKVASMPVPQHKVLKFMTSYYNKLEKSNITKKTIGVNEFELDAGDKITSTKNKVFTQHIYTHTHTYTHKHNNTSHNDFVFYRQVAK